MKGSTGLVVIALGVSIFLSGAYLPKKAETAEVPKGPKKAAAASTPSAECQLPPPEIDKAIATKMDLAEQFDFKRHTLMQNCIFKQPLDRGCDQAWGLLNEMKLYPGSPTATPKERMERASEYLTIAISTLQSAKTAGCLVE